MQKITMKAQNIQLYGAGGAGSSPMDRGAEFVGDRTTSNPFHRANPYDRWREYVNWYYTSWMARKGVDIPVADAMRGGWEIKKVDPEIARKLKKCWRELDGDAKLARCAKQERLLGGCALLMVVSDNKVGAKGTLAEPMDFGAISSNVGALKSLNVIDINRLSMPVVETDVFSPNYDNPKSFAIDGEDVDTSRLVLFDGAPLFGHTAYTVLYPTPRINPACMGESILTPVYDDLVRATGTAQAAFHLVNMASVMLVMMQDFSALSSSKVGNRKLATMQEIVNSINVYKGAILDGVDVDVKNLPASFGSVPELVMGFVQMLSAAWDIPATRFVGQSPSGLNATGESDLENYYNMVQEYRERCMTPRIEKVLKVLAIQEYGAENGYKISRDLSVEWKNLWNADPKAESEAAKIWLDGIMPLLDKGAISAKDFEAEAKRRNILLLPETKITDMDPTKEGGMFSDQMNGIMDGNGGEDNADGKEQEQAPGAVQGSAESGN